MTELRLESEHAGLVAAAKRFLAADGSEGVFDAGELLAARRQLRDRLAAAERLPTPDSLLPIPPSKESPMPDELDTGNHFLVTRTAEGRIMIQRRLYAAYTPAEAKNLAAWLVALAGPDDAAFAKLVAAIRNS